ncbi:MAG TPA: glucose-6-phosphate isomerase, partial [Hyphomicrobiaceae bacterium]|nr:glucose-6-phosphate isomerase [Hyphomicrobiaceae bacterium]
TLAQFGGWSIPGTTTAAQRKRPATRFYDNLDPETLAGLLSAPNLRDMRFVVISKSGNTPETLSQAIAAMEALRKQGLGDRLGEFFLGITEPASSGQKNGLRTLFEQFAIPLLDHHTGIGGRFAVLTNVGLLAAVARGLDPVALLRGAGAVVQGLDRATQPLDFPPAAGAAATVGLSKARGVRIQVMMPYADRLARFAHWYVQLWAESLGKGGQGTTPIACLGPLDQHSQLQLFMDGPAEHLITFLTVASAGIGPQLSPDLANLAGFNEMAGRAVGDLVDAQTRGVPEALLSAGRPVRSIQLLSYDEVGLGALLMHFMIETILAGYMLELDPFDQPAVELGKRLTREKLG